MPIRHAHKSKSHKNSTRAERRGVGGRGAPVFLSPELLMGTRGTLGGGGSSAAPPKTAPAEPVAAAPAIKMPTAAAKARHQRKKHNRWERNKAEWEAQKAIQKKPKAAPRVQQVAVPAEKPTAPSQPQPASAQPSQQQQPPQPRLQPPQPRQQAGLSASKLAKAARRQAVRKAKRQAEAGGASGDAEPPAKRPAALSSDGGDTSWPIPAPPKPAAATGGGETTLAMGVRAMELSAGSGPVVQDRKTVKVKYVGRLGSSTGKIFDQGSISFKLGKGDVIRGWDIGVQGMRVGGARRLTVPPKAGYGAQRTGEIPPNSTLVFDVTVVS